MLLIPICIFSKLCVHGIVFVVLKNKTSKKKVSENSQAKIGCVNVYRWIGQENTKDCRADAVIGHGRLLNQIEIFHHLTKIGPFLLNPRLSERLYI